MRRLRVLTKQQHIRSHSVLDWACQTLWPIQLDDGERQFSCLRPAIQPSARTECVSLPPDSPHGKTRVPRRDGYINGSALHKPVAGLAKLLWLRDAEISVRSRELKFLMPNNYSCGLRRIAKSNACMGSTYWTWLDQGARSSLKLFWAVETS
jgi:hypothetical protein